MAGAHFGKLFASSGTSALLRQYARSRNIKLSFQTSPYSNCPSCRIRVADLLAPRSRVCACFEVVTKLVSQQFKGMTPSAKTTCPAASLRSGPGCLCTRLGRSDVFCLEAFGPLGDVKLDCLAFLQAAKAACLDSRKMHENVVARLAADKAEAFGVVKPFHCSLFHCVTCLLWISAEKNRCE